MDCLIVLYKWWTKVGGAGIESLDGKSKLADHVFPKAAGANVRSTKSRAFIRGRSLFIDVPPTEVISYAQRNGFEESVIGHLWRTVCRTGVPIVTDQHTPIKTHALSILGPRPSENIHLNRCFFSDFYVFFLFSFLSFFSVNSLSLPLSSRVWLPYKKGFNGESSHVI